MNIVLIFKTMRTYIFWTIISLIFFPLCLLLSLLPENIRYENRIYFYLTSLWSRLLLFFSFVHIKYIGDENLQYYLKTPAIFVANHISALDIVLLDDLLKSYPRIWLSQHTYGKIPLFGTLLRRMHVLVNRHNPRKAVEALVQTCNIAKNKKTHIVIFPEGTRSEDGKLNKFLPGFAYISEKLDRPVIPVFIENADKIWKKGSWIVNSRAATINISIGVPMNFNKDESNEMFVLRVHEWFLNQQKLVS